MIPKIWWCSKERWKCDRRRQESCLQAFNPPPPPPADQSKLMHFTDIYLGNTTGLYQLLVTVPVHHLLFSAAIFWVICVILFLKIYISASLKWYTDSIQFSSHLSRDATIHRFFPSSDMIKILWLLYLLIQRTDMMPEWN